MFLVYCWWGKIGFCLWLVEDDGQCFWKSWILIWRMVDALFASSCIGFFKYVPQCYVWYHCPELGYWMHHTMYAKQLIHTTVCNSVHDKWQNRSLSLCYFVTLQFFSFSLFILYSELKSFFKLQFSFRLDIVPLFERSMFWHGPDQMKCLAPRQSLTPFQKLAYLNTVLIHIHIPLLSFLGLPITILTNY